LTARNGPHYPDSRLPFRGGELAKGPRAVAWSR
jgi:hypothetical protein